MPTKIDFKKTMKEFYQPSPTEVVRVNIPKMKFLMIDGKGSPGNSKEYQDALATLYPVAFKIKFISKGQGKDYVVPPSEGLWWADNMDDFKEGNRDSWKWTMMIMQPEWITMQIVKEAIKITGKKKPELKEQLKKLRLEEFEEGRSAQMMHVGPYSEEGLTIAKIHNYIYKNGGSFDGHELKHHEIYLSDPRKADPLKMKTVIRQPFN